MDIQTLLNLVSQIGNGNPNASANGLVNFFNQNNSPKTQETQQQTNINSNQTGINMEQIMPLLSMFGAQNNLANLLPLFSQMQMPNGFDAIKNISGMQNMSPLFNLFNKNTKPQTEIKNQNPANNKNIVRSNNFVKNFDDFKRL